MAYLNYTKAHQDFKEQVLAGIQEHFPIQGKLQTLELENLEVPDEVKSADDIKAQIEMFGQHPDGAALAGVDALIPTKPRGAPYQPK